MRDVIQVERAGVVGEASGNLTELIRVADELLPPLVARLGVSDLGEIEVRQGTWRVRIRRAAAEGQGSASTASSATAGGVGPVATTGQGSSHATPASAPTDHQAALSTAVGYFALKSGLAVGHRVARGDVLGWVDVLGVRKEIVSPADGVVSRFVTEPGDPVEYGQELVALIAATGAAAAAGAATAAAAAGAGAAAAGPGPAGSAAETSAGGSGFATRDPSAPA